MSQFATNNSKYNDLVELKWTLFSGQEDIDDSFYDPSKRSLWLNSSGSSLQQNLLEKLNSYSTPTTTTYLSSFEEGIDYLVANQSDDLLSLNETEKNELEIYYFYKTETLTFLWVLFAMILFGNCSVLITLLMSKNRKTRMNFFIMHLAIADLTVGLVNVATDIAWKTTVGFYAGNVACKIVKYSQVLVTYSSTYVLVSLSIDRYDAITHPLNFSGSWKRARILVASSWALSAIFSIPAIFLNKEAMIEGRPQCWIELEKWQWRIYISLVAVSLFFFPAIIITACYSIIVHTIWTKSKVMTFPKSSNKSKTNKSTSQSHHGRQTNDNKDSVKCSDNENDFKRASSRGIIPKAKIKTVKMTFVIVFVFILCWSPYFVWDLLQVWGAIPVSQTTIAISTFIQSLAPLNSAANPLIYYCFSTHFFRNLRKFSLLRICCKSQRQSRESSSKRINYNTINSTATHSSARTQRFSMTSKSSPKNSTARKTVIIRDVNRTQVHKQNSNEHKRYDSSNSVV